MTMEPTNRKSPEERAQRLDALRANARLGRRHAPLSPLDVDRHLKNVVPRTAAPKDEVHTPSD